MFKQALTLLVLVAGCLGPACVVSVENDPTPEPSPVEDPGPWPCYGTPECVERLQAGRQCMYCGYPPYTQDGACAQPGCGFTYDPDAAIPCEGTEMCALRLSQGRDCVHCPGFPPSTECDDPEGTSACSAADAGSSAYGGDQ